MALIDTGCRPHSFMSVEVAERLRGWKFRRRETLLEGIFGDGREWRSTQAITVDLVLDGTSFGGDVKVLQNISLLTETEDLDVGVGELQEAFPLEDTR